jgi:hypothetical protein
MEILQPIYEMQIPITSAPSPELACHAVALAKAGKHGKTLPRITRMQTDEILDRLVYTLSHHNER